MGRPVRVVDYDLSTFDFAALLRDALGERDLTTLVADRAGQAGWSIYKVMEQSTSYRAFWAVTEGSDFADLYRHFIRTVVVALFDTPILVQTCPTPRIVYADQAGEPRFHRDSDYGHDAQEINLQVVLTPAFATNAMWIESVAGLGDHRPAELKPGQMLMFDGANLAHGAVPNETGRSRVSFDFRVIREDDATPAHRVAHKGAQRGPHVFAAFG